MSDIFREVDEEVRREHYKELWDKYGTFIIAAAVVIALGTLGYQGWTAYIKNKQAEESDRFRAAVALVVDEKWSEAAAAFGSLSSDAGDGYAVLAKFQQAGAMTRSGDIEVAVELYDSISTSGGVDALLKDLARIRAAQMLMGAGSTADLRARVGSLANDQNAWRYSAREILAYADFRDGDLTAAYDRYRVLTSDLLAPQAIQRRAQELIMVIGPRPGSFDGNEELVGESSSSSEVETDELLNGGDN